MQANEGVGEPRDCESITRRAEACPLRRVLQNIFILPKVALDIINVGENIFSLTKKML